MRRVLELVMGEASFQCVGAHDKEISSVGRM